MRRILFLPVLVGLGLTACTTEPIDQTLPDEQPPAAIQSVDLAPAQHRVLFEGRYSVGISPKEATALFAFVRATTPWGDSTVWILGPHATDRVGDQGGTLSACRSEAIRRALELGGVSPIRIQTQNTLPAGGWHVLVE